MRDDNAVDEFIKNILERYNAAELVDLLDLSTSDVVDAFLERILDAGPELLD